MKKSQVVCCRKYAGKENKNKKNLSDIIVACNLSGRKEGRVLAGRKWKQPEFGALRKRLVG